jgi:hypothetical protein
MLWKLAVLWWSAFPTIPRLCRSCHRSLVAPGRLHPLFRFTPTAHSGRYRWQWLTIPIPPVLPSGIPSSIASSPKSRETGPTNR